jgi:hypothetical protein
MKNFEVQWKAMLQQGEEYTTGSMRLGAILPNSWTRIHPWKLEMDTCDEEF